MVIVSQMYVLVIFKVYMGVSAERREVRCGQRSRTRRTDTRRGCEQVRLTLRTLTHTQNFPLAMTDGTNSQRLPSGVELFPSRRDCSSAGSVPR